jgi:hypothetical protein
MLSRNPRALLLFLPSASHDLIYELCAACISRHICQSRVTYVCRKLSIVTVVTVFPITSLPARAYADKGENCHNYHNYHSVKLQATGKASNRGSLHRCLAFIIGPVFLPFEAYAEPRDSCASLLYQHILKAQLQSLCCSKLTPHGHF